MRTWLVLLTFLLSLALPAFSVPQTAWVTRFNFGNPSRDNLVHSMIFDNSGNIIIAGTATSASGDRDYCVLKYSQSGTQQWAVTYNSGPLANDQLRAMTVDSNGNVYVTGTSRTVKYNSNGLLQWVAPYGGRGLAADTNGFAYVVGFQGEDFMTVKLTAAEGTNVWLRTYDYAGKTDRAQAVAVGPAGEVHVGGQFTYDCDQLGCYVKFGLVKYDANGSLQWARLWAPQGDVWHGLRGDSGVKRVIVTSNENIYVAGNFYGGSAGVYVIGAFDAGGTLAWSFNLERNDDQMKFLVLHSSGEFYMTGWSEAAVPLRQYYRTVVVRSNGTERWHVDRDPGTPSNHQANCIALDSGGSVFVTGQSSSTYVNSVFDFLTIKYDNNGRELWNRSYNGPANGSDIAMGILVAPDGGIFVAGYSANTNGGTDITLIKYVELQNIQWQGSQVLLQFLAPNAQPCRIQASINLTAWSDLATLTPDANNLVRYTDTNSRAFPYRFYRMLCP